MEASDRVVVVSGAGRGIGRASVQLLLQRGFRVVAIDHGGDLRGQQPDAGVVAGLHALTHRAGTLTTHAFDVGDAPRLRATLDALPRLDAFVHAAGVWHDASVMQSDASVIEDVTCAPIRAAFVVAQQVAERFVRQRAGHLIMMAGTSAFLGARGHAAMAAAQAAIVALVRTLALETRRHGVAVNAVCPVARTRMTEGLPTFQAIAPASMTPEHVASLVAFMIDRTDLTGQCLGVAGSRVYAIESRESDGLTGDGGPLTASELAERWDEVARSR